jgi:hypothetical protein
MNRFLDERKDNWQRLEELLDMQGVRGVRSLSRLEVREFGKLYRRAAADLAIARAETRDPKLINYLNSLVIRAHGRIYRSESDGAGVIAKFFAEELPQTWRRNWRFMASGAVVFVVFALSSFLLAYNNSEFGEVLGLEPYRVAAETNRPWWLRINEANQIEASNILTNNIRVSFLAFAWGVFLCVGAIYILAVNGAMIGAVVAVCHKANPAFGQ